MKFQQATIPISNPKHLRSSSFGGLLALVAWLGTSPAAFAAIPWDGEGNDGNWFNPANWNRNDNDNNTLPPGSPGVTDTEISSGTATLNGGLGVIYDTDLPGDTGPDNPFFPVPDAVNDPPVGNGYQQIAQLYISRSANPPAASVVPDNTLTLRGDLESSGPVIVGRSSGVAGMATNGKIIQQSGLFKIPLSNMDLGNAEAAPRAGFGNGTYDYQGGRLEVSQDGGSGLRLAAGGGGGAGGVGRFIMRNPGPTSPGYVRAFDVNVAANEGNATILANGTTNGVGIFEFHSNGANGTRPVQVNRNLIINNGSSGTAGAVRSARLELVLDAPPTVDQLGVPQDLGLFDVGFSTDGTSTTGAGDLGDFFSSADASTVYTQDATVSAMYQGSTYNWTISYVGDITWADASAGVVGSISDMGGNDVVLKGLSSIIVPVDLPGDFNSDGRVDAADYVVWRKTDGNQPGYDEWRTNFGRTTAGATAGWAPPEGWSSSASVPEPAAILLLLAALAAGLVSRRVR